MIETSEYEQMLRKMGRRKMGRRDGFIKRLTSSIAVLVGPVLLVSAGCITIAAFFGIGILISMGIVALLWNVLLPLFWLDAPILGAWQCFGAAVILMLLRLLFGGFQRSEK